MILGRFFEGIRQIYAILAGCMAATWRSFILSNLLGATVWVAFWAAAVLYFGHAWRQIWHAFRDHEVFVLLGLALISGLSALLLHLYARQRVAASKTSEMP